MQGLLSALFFRDVRSAAPRAAEGLSFQCSGWIRRGLRPLRQGDGKCVRVAGQDGVRRADNAPAYCDLNHKFAAYASEVARQGYASGGKLVNGVDGSEKMGRQFNRKSFGCHMT